MKIIIIISCTGLSVFGILACDLLKIEEGEYKTEIIVDDIEFPTLPDISADMLDISEHLLNILKTAIKYTGEGIQSYVYLCDKYITATDGSRCFFHSNEFHTIDPIGINKKILSILFS